MNQERVERLEALLSRVQENRKRARTPAGLGMTSALKPETARAAPEPAKPVHAVHTQTAAGLMPAQQPAAAPAPVFAAAPEPARPVARPAQQPAAAPVASSLRSAAPPPSKLQMPARPAAQEPAPAARPAASVAEPSPSRKAAQAVASPLEMAVAELEMGAGAKAEARREPAPAATPLAPAISPDEAFEPRRIEPEPMREPARPIAQVMSRHSPQVDATFGAMLKRSLSLRPH